MSKCIKRNASFLKKLAKLGPSDRDKLIADATPDQIRALTEIALNITSGNFTLGETHLSKLATHRHIIRKLAKRTLSHKKKKGILLQTGGFLPLLLTPILSALGSLVGRVVGSHLSL